MRSKSLHPVILGLALVLSAGCRDDGGAQLITKPLLQTGTEIDLIRISEAVWAREAAVGVKALSPAERVFLYVWNLEAEVNNGGFEQFYLNSAGDNAIDTPAALREIGATAAAAIVEAANSVFSSPGPPSDRDARTKALERLGTPATDALNALDARFYEYPDNLAAMLTTFVERNREQFYEPQ
jgi:hypothetical protein